MTQPKIMSRALLGGSLLLGGWLAATGAPAGAQAARPTSSACTTIALTNFVFHPSSVRPGHSSTAVLTAHNCTGTTQDASVTWEGQFVGPGGAIPEGCPVIDPIARPLHIRPHMSVRSRQSYLVPDGCAATSLEVTATIQQNGKVRAQGTATLVVKGAVP